MNSKGWSSVFYGVLGFRVSVIRLGFGGLLCHYHIGEPYRESLPGFVEGLQGFLGLCKSATVYGLQGNLDS